MAIEPNSEVRYRHAGGKLRVLVVDACPVTRYQVSQALKLDREIALVGVETNGAAALADIPAVRPHVVLFEVGTLFVEELAPLRQIQSRYPELRTVIFSGSLDPGVPRSDVLAAGADDYVPLHLLELGPEESALGLLRSKLIPHIKQFASQWLCAGSPAPSAGSGVRRRFRVLAIGISTGGPKALVEVIARLPGNLPVPVLVVQHMLPSFTRLLAERLCSSTLLPVAEASDGLLLRPGRLIVARGGFHLRVRRQNQDIVTELNSSPPQNFCRPAVDVLFKSLAEVYGGDVLSVVLTGMGNDGLRGTRVLKAAGAYSLVQDEATSVVWGMPGAIAAAGLADAVLPLPHIASEIVRLIAHGGV